MISVVFVTNVPAPYKRSRLNALAALEDIDLHVIYAHTRTHRHEYDVDDETLFTFEMHKSRRIPISGGEFMLDTWSLRRLLNIKADAFVVGGWNYLAAWSAVLASKVRDIPVALISANYSQRTAVSSLLARPAVQAFDTHFALSTAAEEHFVNLGAAQDTVTVLPNSIDVEAFRARLDGAEQDRLRTELNIGDAFLVLYVGRLSEAKGVDDLIGVVGSMKRSDLHLLVVGDGPDRASLERQARTELHDAVTFTGALPNEALPNYYAIADAFVLPTHGDTWGLVLNEAMVCRTPVITTSAAGAVGDLVRDGETGLVVPPGDRTALRNALVRLAAADRLADRLAERGAEEAAEYTPEAYARRMRDAIDSQLK